MERGEQPSRAEAEAGLKEVASGRASAYKLVRTPRWLMVGLAALAVYIGLFQLLPPLYRSLAGVLVLPVGFGLFWYYRRRMGVWPGSAVPGSPSAILLNPIAYMLVFGGAMLLDELAGWRWVWWPTAAMLAGLVVAAESVRARGLAAWARNSQGVG